MEKSFEKIKVVSSGQDQIIDITEDVSRIVSLNAASDGICVVYVPHTTAAVTINENADPDVKSDILKGIGEIVPENLKYKHAEGNSPAHIKASLLGSSVNVIVENNKLQLGTWQGIYFCEFDGPRNRNVYVKIIEG